jgi:hypothetical protein
LFNVIQLTNIPESIGGEIKNIRLKGNSELLSGIPECLTGIPER